jgi:hypothetical protein
MPTKSAKCPKCEGAMERGYVARPWATYAGQPERWVAGRAPSEADFRVSAKAPRARTVVSWRCADCGFLESYAR